MIEISCQYSLNRKDTPSKYYAAGAVDCYMQVRYEILCQDHLARVGLHYFGRQIQTIMSNQNVQHLDLSQDFLNLTHLDIHAGRNSIENLSIITATLAATTSPNLIRLKVNSKDILDDVDRYNQVANCCWNLKADG